MPQPALDDSAKSAEIKELLAEIAELSDKVTFKEDNSLPVRKPSFLITNPGSNQGLVTLGDPGVEQSLKIIDALIEAGADALELGIPFSDPLADGPTIQNATLRAFAAGVTPAQCFEMLCCVFPAR